MNPARRAFIRLVGDILEPSIDNRFQRIELLLYLFLWSVAASTLAAVSRSLVSHTPPASIAVVGGPAALRRSPSSLIAAWLGLSRRSIIWAPVL